MNLLKKIISDMRYAIAFTLISIIAIAFAWNIYINGGNAIRVETTPEITHKEFQENINSGKYIQIYFTNGSQYVMAELEDNTFHKVMNFSNDTMKDILLNSGVKIRNGSELETAEKIEETRKSRLTLLITLVTVFDIYAMLNSRSNDKTRKSVYNEKCIKAANASSDNTIGTQENLNATGIYFKDVAGLTEVKKDVYCLVDFVSNKHKYISAGAKLPRGVIFYGPPGTGKTLLAKAIAGEANVPFIYMSGSDFVEKYVGVGAKRVRDLFAAARSYGHCIIFIDELDAIGGARGNDDSSEDRKTLLALLTEMDGFRPSDSIIVIGATNRIEDLDPALTRPGRFTNKYCIPLPETVEERREIIDMYSKNKRFDETVDFNSIAKDTIGFSPAKIEALLNEAAIISVSEDKCSISAKHVDKAMYKLLLKGHMKERGTGRDAEVTKCIAWHEAGHAIAGYVLGKDITKVSIIPSTSGAGGVTFSIPKNISTLSAEEIESEIIELYAGRIGELLLYEGELSKVTTGASNDIERASILIHNYIVKYGMSEKFGLLYLSKSEASNKCVIDDKIKLAKRLEEKSKKLLIENYDKLKAIAETLIKKNTINKKELIDIIEGRN